MAKMVAFPTSVLRDQDFETLMASPDGAATFGVFSMLVVCGRERLEAGRAVRLDETPALVFLDRTRHIARLIWVDLTLLERSIVRLGEVARSNGSTPWAYFAGAGQLVISSFFAFMPPRSGRPYVPGWGATRERVFERDAYTCAYCGRVGGRLECDHIIPVSRGGGSDDDNLTTACRRCNRSKRDRTAEEFLR